MLIKEELYMTNSLKKKVLIQITQIAQNEL